MNPVPIQNAVPIPRPNHRRPGPQANPSPVGGGPQLSDIAYVVFRHKFKILICALAGLVAAVAFWFASPSLYVSDAKLLVRYVVESRSVGPADASDQLMSPDSRGENIITSEVELLSSLDLATVVAASVGPTNFVRNLAGVDAATAAATAAQVVRANLKIEVKPKSNVIGISFQHESPFVAKEVIEKLIPLYHHLHAKVHRALEEFDGLGKQAEQKRFAVDEAERQLRALKTSLGITSLVEAQKSVESRMISLRNELSVAEASLAENRAALGILTNRLAVAATNMAAPAIVGAVGTNSTASSTNLSLAGSPVSSDSRQEYMGLLDRLEALRRHEQELLLQFNPTSIYVRPITEQIMATRKRRDEMAAAEPALALVPTAASNRPSAPGQAVSTEPDPTIGWARLVALEARVQYLKEQLEAAKAEDRRLADKAPDIVKLERKLEIDAKQAAYFSSALEKATVDQALATTRLANIAVIQNPSPAAKALVKKLKIVGGLAGGGLALGLALAFLIEFVIDSSVRRPAQVMGRMHMPLYLSIPRLRPPPSVPQMTPSNGSGSPVLSPASNGLITYSEALRDRLIMHFQIRELHHKPKLIGVTSFGRGAGVTSVATSLAAALSETGEGNVLYVDVSPNTGPSAHPFRQGRPVVAIQEALTESTRDLAQIQENLYAVSLSDPNSNRVGVLPRTLAALVPQIKESSYDYIIFDLPPVTQTSITARVAGLLDVNVVVIESEKTHCGKAEQAAALLAESNSQMVAVLNKHRRYLPGKLDADL